MTGDAPDRAALFVSHTAEMGGAELFLMDLLRHGPPGWGACFLEDGPAARALETSGRPAIVLAAGASVLSVRRGSSALKLAGAALGVVRLARDLARAARGYQVVCANSQKALFVAALATRLMRRPLVWILHDILTDPHFSTATRRAAVTVANLCAARVVANSSVTAQAFVAAGGRAAKLRIVHNGFDPAAHPRGGPDRSATLRAEFGLDARPVIGLFGRLTPWKGQHILLAALARVPDVQALIVGGPLFGEAEHEAHLERLAADLGLSERVRFTGFRADVADLMAGVDIVVHASTQPEPFGRVVVEGMLAGRPVVAAGGGGVAEIVEDGRTGLLVAPGDPDELADAIRRLVADPVLARSLAEAGRADAAERYAIAATCRDMTAVLAEVAPR